MRATGHQNLHYHPPNQPPQWRPRTKTLPHQSRTDSLGDRSLGEDALLASDDDHHGDHLEQRQAANSIDKLRTPADADDVLADGGRILPDDLANFTAPAPARGTGDTSDGRQRGGGEPGRLPAGGPSWRAGAHGGGRAHDCGGHGGGHQQQPAATVGQPGAPADDDPRRPARESGDTERRLEAASHTDHQACGADQRRTGSGGASKQRAGASLWQNSLSRMSNKLNLFAGSTKRRTGAKSKPKAGGGGAGADAHQEQVMLDSWIETKVVSLFGPFGRALFIRPALVAGPLAIIIRLYWLWPARPAGHRQSAGRMRVDKVVKASRRRPQQVSCRRPRWPDRHPDHCRRAAPSN